MFSSNMYIDITKVGTAQVHISDFIFVLFYGISTTRGHLMPVYISEEVSVV